MNAPATELIVPLDIDRLDHALRLVDRLGDAVDFYKVGLELFSVAGPEALHALRARQKRVFLDLKLHDIPTTVARAAAAAASQGVALFTVHAGGGGVMLQAARDALSGVAAQARPRMLAVTVLTSMDRADLRAVGVADTPEDHALRLARLAWRHGADGVVCSPLEAAVMRGELGPAAAIVTPGVRPRGSDRADQKRVATPAEAVRQGATHLVVGRPITAAADPRAAALSITEEMRAAAMEAS